MVLSKEIFLPRYWFCWHIRKHQHGKFVLCWWALVWYRTTFRGAVRLYLHKSLNTLLFEKHFWKILLHKTGKSRLRHTVTEKTDVGLKSEISLYALKWIIRFRWLLISACNALKHKTCSLHLVAFTFAHLSKFITELKWHLLRVFKWKSNF